ncbi:hypothetical protein CK203_059299 [Vitis vinifera]|uniref:Uncharacterized protein n=1 Tax=Vitis vinifera TaxID=29760 RepID=A0A438FSQ9_VITVI|nr:hypothetical protein CK203_059299 [Vitis vinifera]
MDQELGDQNFDLEKKSENSFAVGDYDSYWEQIRRLDKKAEFQQLVRRMKQLEDEREIIRQDNGGKKN